MYRNREPAVSRHIKSKFGNEGSVL